VLACFESAYVRHVKFRATDDKSASLDRPQRSQCLECNTVL